MVARLNRPRPLPEATQPRVADSSAQRAFDLLFVPLREVIRFLQPLIAPSWKPLPQPGNGYAPYGTISGSRPPEYTKVLDRVYFRGAISAPIAPFVGRLPVGYRPAGTVRIPVVTAGGAFDYVQVGSDGSVLFVGGNDCYLDNLSFSAEPE